MLENPPDAVTDEANLRLSDFVTSIMMFIGGSQHSTRSQFEAEQLLELPGLNRGGKPAEQCVAEPDSERLAPLTNLPNTARPVDDGACAPLSALLIAA